MNFLGMSRTTETFDEEDIFHGVISKLTESDGHKHSS